MDKNKPFNANDMLAMLKKSKARPITIDDILKNKVVTPKAPDLQAPKPIDRNKPVIIPILADISIEGNNIFTIIR